MNKLKICYITPCVSVGGGIRVVFEQANELIKRGHEVYLLPTDEMYAQDWYPELKAQIIMPGQLEYLKPDIIIATHWSTVYFIEELKSKAKKFYLVQGKEPWFDMTQYTKVVKTYEMGYHIITIADNLHDWLKEEYKVESDVVLNGINFNQFYPEVNEGLKVFKDRPVVLIEGNTQAGIKNVLMGLSAIRPLKDLDLIEVWILSADNMYVNRSLYDKRFIKPNPKLLRQIYSTADIMLKPSLLEGASLPPMEAMACKTCVVVSDIPGNRQFDRGDNMVVCVKNDEKSYRNALSDLLNNASKLISIAEAGYQTALKEFNWAEKIDKIVSIFNK